jgi:hypothetical protein
VDSPGSGYRSLVGCCECSDGPSGSGATELISRHFGNEILMMKIANITNNESMEKMRILLFKISDKIKTVTGKT